MGVNGVVEAEKGRERERVEKWRPVMTTYLEMEEGRRAQEGRGERGESKR